MILGRRFSFARPQSFFALIGVCLIALMGLGGCGTDDTSGNNATNCRFDSDCAFGTVCSNAGACVEASCDFCEAPDQVCTTPDSPDQGTCTSRECSFDDECDGELVCYEGICVDEAGGGEGCDNDDDCDEGEMCNLAGECVDDTGGGDDCTDSADCAEGEFCNLDTNSCEAGECYDSMDCAEGENCDSSNTCVDGSDDCTPGSCGADQTCNTDTGQCEDDTGTGCDPACAQGQHCEGTTCVDDCTAGSCPTDQTCNTTTGECELDNGCPAGSPDPGSCTSGQVFDDNLCACVECTDDSMCTGDERCNGNGQCVPQCQTSCTSQTAQQDCGNNTPYCVSNCCVECIGNADCSSGQACLDGFCGDAPDCTNDPSICRTDYTCNQSTGQCEPDQPGGDCTQDPTICPSGTTCNPDNGQCEGLGGGGGGNCGFCEANCSCSDGLTCDTTIGICTGCQISLSDPTGGCPDGQICFDSVCFPFDL